MASPLLGVTVTDRPCLSSELLGVTSPRTCRFFIRGDRRRILPANGRLGQDRDRTSGVIGYAQSERGPAWFSRRWESFRGFHLVLGHMVLVVFTCKHSASFDSRANNLKPSFWPYPRSHLQSPAVRFDVLCTTVSGTGPGEARCLSSWGASSLLGLTYDQANCASLAAIWVALEEMNALCSDLTSFGSQL